MASTRSKGAPLIPYHPELRKTIRNMMNAQELEAQRQRLRLETETAARGIQQNVLNNPPRVVDKNPGVEEIAPPYRQQLAPRGRAQQPAQMMFEEDDLDLDGARATRAIVLHVLPPDMFRGAIGDDANLHLTNFVAICKSQEIPELMDEMTKNNRAWHTREAEVEDLGVTFELSVEQRRREAKRDQDMAHLRT
ncbi:hypothetical protein KY290_011723 [Solanum tuberosum]|uniref:Gag-pol polyprotein n=1 Tax=Solanum tuberosum TaxID=4113 RepID=A0ABQ7W2R5_SOLTU|nr:hypothetical protein KY289_012974 [Solanum tuberosum]KAH0710397.1 hypothetical protein KY284_011824 [Solanum tuberosum]KAH0736061.1 hypothetical protein KY285_011768 [Solanum tuberosum]KAH0774586.1 hypothetical protein KY290_011723 [Solanum tuberosum]